MARSASRSIGMTTQDECGKCGRALLVRHSVWADFGGIRYGCGYSCPDCGTATELDGDEPPDDVRALLEQEHGQWSVATAAGDLSAARVIARLLRKRNQRSLRQTAELVARTAAGEPFFVGLAPEALALSALITHEA